MKDELFNLQTIGDPDLVDDVVSIDTVRTEPDLGYEMNHGESVKERLVGAKAVVEHGTEKRKLTPLLSNTNNLLILSRAAKDVVAALCANVECLPVAVVDDKGASVSDDYFIVHPVGHFDAINARASDVQYFEDGTANTYEVVLDPNKAANAPLLFRVPEAATTFIARKALLKALLGLPDRSNFYVVGIECEAAAPGEGNFAQSGALISAAGESASAAKLKKLAALLDAGANPNVESGDETALTAAIGKNDVAAVELLLARGADPNHGSEKPKLRPLLACAYGGTLPVLEALLKGGAKPAACPVGVWLILGDSMGAAHRKDIVPMMRRLAVAGANFDLGDDGWTGLGKAIWGKHADYAKTLIELGASVNGKAGWDMTPLHLAATIGLDVIAPLLARGADVNAVNDKGQTPLDLTQHKKIKAALQAAGGVRKAAESPEPDEAPQPRKLSPKERLLRKKVALALAERFEHHGDIYREIASGQLDVDEVDGTGQPFLHILCQSDAVDEVRAYIEELGGDARVHGRGGLLATHEAIQSGSARVFAYLLDRLNDVACADNEFRATLLHWACQAPAMSAMARTLLERGADPNALDGQGWPPLAIAIGSKSYEQQRLLYEHGANVDLKLPSGLTVREGIAKDGDAKTKALLASSER